MLSNPLPLRTDADEDLMQLYDYVLALKREIDDAIYNLDSDNIAELNATVIRTALSGARIELMYNGIASYNASNQLHGLYYNPASPDAQLRLYHNGVSFFDIERLTGGLIISSFGTRILGFNDSVNLTQPLGEWDFSNAVGVYGLDSKGYATKRWVTDEISAAVNELKTWVTANFVHK